VKRFSFPLERVRRWRQTEVDLAQAKLEGFIAALRKLQLAKLNLKQQLDAAGAAAQEGTAAGARYDADRLAGLETFRQFVRRRQLEIMMEETQCQRQIDAQRLVVTEARRNYKVLERLREKALAEWNRAYAKELEDMASDLHLAKLRNRAANTR
jgi:flagellar export protein FliJ